MFMFRMFGGRIMPFFVLDLEHQRGNRHYSAGLSVREVQSLDGMASRLWTMSQKKNLYIGTQSKLHYIIIQIEDALDSAGRLHHKLPEFEEFRRYLNE